MGKGTLPTSVGTLLHLRGIGSPQRQFTFLLGTPPIFSQLHLLIPANHKQLPFLALWWLVSLLNTVTHIALKRNEDGIGSHLVVQFLILT